MTRFVRPKSHMATWLAVAFLALSNVSFYAQASTATAVASTVVPRDADDIPRVGGPLTFQPMTFRDQARFYARHTYDPGSLLIPALPAAIIMADPPKNYPHEWRDGGQAFGRNFGDAFTVQTAANTGKFLAGFMLREDPRYFPDTKHAVHTVSSTLWPSRWSTDPPTEGLDLPSRTSQGQRQVDSLAGHIFRAVTPIASTRASVPEGCM